MRRQKSKRKNRISKKSRNSRKSMFQIDRSKKTGPKRRVEIDGLK